MRILLLYLHTGMIPRYQIFLWLWPGGGVGWGGVRWGADDDGDDDDDDDNDDDGDDDAVGDGDGEDDDDADDDDDLGVTSEQILESQARHLPLYFWGWSLNNCWQDVQQNILNLRLCASILVPLRASILVPQCASILVPHCASILGVLWGSVSIKFEVFHRGFSNVLKLQATEV